MDPSLRVVGLALAGAVLFIAGYVSGGFVYEVAGGGAWSWLAALQEWQTLITGLAAGAAAIYAAQRAWTAVERQITADNLRAEAGYKIRLRAQADTVSLLLFLAAKRVRAIPVSPIEDYVIAAMIRYLEPAMEMDSRLGACLASWLKEVQFNNEAASESEGEIQRPDQQFVTRFAARTELLSLAFMKATADLGSEGKIRSDRLVSEADLEETGFLPMDAEFSLGWADLLTGPRLP